MNINPIKIIDVKQALGELVKQLRKRENLTQEELAQRLVVTRGTIKNLEHDGILRAQSLSLVMFTVRKLFEKLFHLVL